MSWYWWAMLGALVQSILAPIMREVVIALIVIWRVERAAWKAGRRRE